MKSSLINYIYDINKKKISKNGSKLKLLKIKLLKMMIF